jgi:acyl-coenzyme A synthetase/AMP-(fatty) acid ligase
VQPPEIPTPELAVWSGDQVVRDEEGYLYFVSRKDDMIKTSGYRVSPNEVEEIAYASGLVAGAAALGVPHDTLGQAILLVFTHADAADPASVEADLLTYMRQELPNYMVPGRLVMRESLPHNQNGKIDRRALSEEYRDTFRTDNT